MIDEYNNGKIKRNACIVNGLLKAELIIFTVCYVIVFIVLKLKENDSITSTIFLVVSGLWKVGFISTPSTQIGAFINNSQDERTNDYKLHMRMMVCCILGFSILTWIAAGYLYSNAILIRDEWEEKPPMFMRLEQRAQEAEQAKQKKEQAKKELENKLQLYKTSIEKCGFHFFIKYCEQIAALPLRDVEVSENYSAIEKQERLLAAKELIEKGLCDFTLQQIERQYKEYLSPKECAFIQNKLAK